LGNLRWIDRRGHVAVDDLQFSPNGHGLQFVLDADDADGKPLHGTYGGPLDGREQPLAGVDAVLARTRYDDRSIESTLTRGGNVADRAKSYPIATRRGSCSMDLGPTVRRSATSNFIAARGNKWEAFRLSVN
jgi:hypothetical protein